MASNFNPKEMLGVMDAVLKTMTGKGIDAMIEEHMDEEAVEATSLDQMADQITDRIKADAEGRTLPVSLMLTEPLTLTVKKANKPGDGYSKKAHTGGEEFSPVRCYAGKRGALLYVFKPLAVAEYLEMEMPEAQAKTALSGFETWLKTIIDFELDRSRKEAQQASALKAEREKLADRTEKYGTEFASW